MKTTEQIRLEEAREKEFLSPHGSRSLSRYHAEHPYVFNVGGQDYLEIHATGMGSDLVFGNQPGRDGSR